MSFKARRQPLSGQIKIAPSSKATNSKSTLASGVRPSPLDGRPITSTGTRSLDSLLAGHVGLALGNLLLIEETGTTDFAGCLLKYYAAEGAVQGHQVHVLGINEVWGTELPGIASEIKVSKEVSETASIDKMKIAWRYERLGEFGAEVRERSVGLQGNSSASIFCHDFDLSRRLPISNYSNIKFVPAPNNKDFNSPASPFSFFLSHLLSQLKKSSSDTIHRIVIPSLLSPLFYPAEFCNPQSILQFFHTLRALLRIYSSQITAIITIPLTLYSRDTGLTRWMELLSDGVLELAPLTSAVSATFSSEVKSARDEAPQGILKIHKLPIFHEKGGGNIVGGLSRVGDNLAFSLSRRKGLIIKPFSLPPISGDLEIKSASSEKERSTNEDIQF
ncbi:Elongator complex protein 4 [Erysiphe neolycopersici]|uniref:Elongator complex protein 4 n=1 Tax=Erysiphe neolycopersici TaxID=212602 RepID=A0A420HPD4_9PEZI|nr:Elongator complex protein 4 [Erysiphe neolycopersici]